MFTKDISTTTAQFMLRKASPKKMRTNAVVTEESETYKAPNINGNDNNNPVPQITGSIQAIFFLSK